MATNTERDIGFQKNFGTLGPRNFEDSGTVQYVSNRPGLILGASTYNVGVTIAFDAGSNYSAVAIETLRLYFNQGWIKPLV